MENKMKLVDVGFGNLVSVERIVSIAATESMPIRRLIQDAKDAGRAIDVSCGKKTASVVITDSEYVVLSADSVEAIKERIDNL